MDVTFIPVCALQLICKVAASSVGDVDRAVAAAKEAFENGPWGRMNPRDRGSMLYRSAPPPGAEGRGAGDCGPGAPSGGEAL